MAVTFRERVRRRPGMYVGDTANGQGELNIVRELVANVIDQHWAGRCSRIEVDVAPDGIITVRDDGPGLADHSTVFERASNRPTVDGHRPHVHIAMGSGVGLVVINALSERFGVSTIRDGIESRARYERGVLVEPWSQIATNAPSGTTIRLRCDREIFVNGVPNPDELADQLAVLADLVPTLDFGRRDVGLAHRVARRAVCAVDQVMRAHEVVGDIDVDLAVVLADRREIESFANLARTPEHGAHVDGLREVLGDRDAIGAVSVILADVRFGAPTRDRLLTPAAGDAVASVARKMFAGKAARSLL